MTVGTCVAVETRIDISVSPARALRFMPGMVSASGLPPTTPPDGDDNTGIPITVV